MKYTLVSKSKTVSAIFYTEKSSPLDIKLFCDANTLECSFSEDATPQFFIYDMSRKYGNRVVTLDYNMWLAYGENGVFTCDEYEFLKDYGPVSE